MKKILRPAWAEIDLDAIAYNTRNIKQLIGHKDLIAYSFKNIIRLNR